MKVFYMESNDLTNNFVFCYNNPPLNNKSVWQLYSINKNIDEYFKYSNTYINLKDYIRSNDKNINDVHISNIHLPEFLKNNNIMKFQENRELIFHFPDDYPEEDLFYFCLKFNAKQLLT